MGNGCGPASHVRSITASQFISLRSYEETVKRKRVFFENFVIGFCPQKYAPVIVADERGAKNDIRFFCGKIPAQAGLMQQAEQGICTADLILLTHAGCAFKDPRGRFGISYPCALPPKSGRAGG